MIENSLLAFRNIFLLIYLKEVHILLKSVSLNKLLILTLSFVFLITLALPTNSHAEVNPPNLTNGEVIQLKLDLAKVGFSVSTNPNGNYGPATTHRVREFQKTYGIPVTGMADTETLNLLNELTSNILYAGMSDPRVITLKEQLAIMGFRVSNNPNGNYGPATAAKVKEFQRAYGLPATGSADKFTLERLHSLATGPLLIGMHREDVIQLKIDLGKAGYTVPGDTTTYFGPLTESRLKAFQQANGLTADGIAGQETLTVLNDRISLVIINSLTSSEVIQLKINLEKVGFKVSNNPNGNYGPATTQKVSEFQSTYGLEATGIADSTTRNLLNELTSNILYPGMSDSRVITLKEQLAVMGFPVSTNPNGNYGPSTTQTVREFQQAYRLPITGSADKFTLERLNSFATGPLRKGMYRQDVIRLKKDLDKVGFTVAGSTSTYFGPLTERQVIAFQRANGLTSDGIAGPATLKKLEDLIKAMQPPPAPTSLRNGDRHPAVIDLKKDLAKVGFPVPGNTTEAFGPSTERRVSAFQLANGLSGSGVAGPATRKKLQEAISKLPKSGTLKGVTIIVDPGHGGKDPGAIGVNGLRESFVVLDIGRRLEPKLRAAGANVIMTRSTDIFVPLEIRSFIANQSNGTSFISIHTNSFNKSTRGTETYWNRTSSSRESKELAEFIQKELVVAMQTTNRGVKEGNFHVIRETNMPSVLVEVGFIDNASDGQKLGSSTYRERAANAIFKGINEYYKNR